MSPGTGRVITEEEQEEGEAPAEEAEEGVPLGTGDRCGDRIGAAPEGTATDNGPTPGTVTGGAGTERASGKPGFQNETVTGTGARNVPTAAVDV